MSSQWKQIPKFFTQQDIAEKTKTKYSGINASIK